MKPQNRSTRAFDALVFALAAMVAVSTVLAQPPAAVTPKPVQAKSQARPAPDSEPASLLKAARDKYQSAKTYQDEGEVTSELLLSSGTIASVMPYRTAFERDGRFLWEFKGSATPGAKPDYSYTVWSKDQKHYESLWTLVGERQDFDTIDMALAGPTGISGGLTTVVIPLLRPDMTWTMRTTELGKPFAEGKEMVEGVECTKIRGNLGDNTVTLWLDSTGAIRKYERVSLIDPSKIPGAAGGPNAEKFTARITVTVKPVFDEKIDNTKFEPPKAAK